MSRNKLTPVYQVDFPLLSRIGYELWPKENFNTIETLLLCKQFYNLAYNKLIEELNYSLIIFHPAAWIRVSYIQLQIWSLVLYNFEHKTKVGNVEGPSMFAPIGRYGWRYILEISLENLGRSKIKHSLRPQDTDIAKVFTLLLAISHCSEYSNYLHYFREHLSSVKIKLSPYLFTKGPIYNKRETKFYENVIDYIKLKPDWIKYKEFSIDNNEILMRMINNMLLKYFGFNLDDVKILTEIIISKISLEIGASILIAPYDYAIDLFTEYCTMPHSKIKSIINFLLLDTKSSTYISRDFLSRSQQERMLNYGGTIIYLDNYLETIYDSMAAKYDFVISSNKHIILTGTLIAEWLDVFTSRLVYGQRQDLKNINGELNQTISEIETYFHRNIFESTLKELITKRGFHCLSLDKIEGKSIPCGEIDIIAYHAIKKILLIAEAKYHAPAKDARSMGKVISDHFKQKKYHQKFITKINWINNNMKIINEIFYRNFSVRIDALCKKEKYYITGSPNAVKFIIEEYEVLTFYEFDKII